MTRTDEQQRVLDAVCGRLREDFERRIGSSAFGIDLGFLKDDERIADAVLAELQKAVPGPWPEEKPKVKCWLDGNVLRTQITMLPGEVADCLARAGCDVRHADGTPYVPLSEEFIITVQEIKRDL